MGTSMGSREKLALVTTLLKARETIAHRSVIERFLNESPVPTLVETPTPAPTTPMTGYIGEDP
ncbi:hypothetical protein TWF481_002865 [Arthrobotrys musiformis]|uniref:Uncharacterized protein n=1 Tax=Arthrobotrys musiformis TaxID=47236 RepID=A0AAV9VRL1_9PEZI